jgi:hypothetical protein
MRFPRAWSLERRRRFADWPFTSVGEEMCSAAGDSGRLDGGEDGGEVGWGCGETGGRITVDCTITDDLELAGRGERVHFIGRMGIVGC